MCKTAHIHPRVPTSKGQDLIVFRLCALYFAADLYLTNVDLLMMAIFINGLNLYCRLLTKAYVTQYM